MKKLKLDLDNLNVDSFQTSRPVGNHRGTVRANDQSEISACGCQNTVFTTRCQDTDGDTVPDYFTPGPGQTVFRCTQEN